MCITITWCNKFPSTFFFISYSFSLLYFICSLYLKVVIAMYRFSSDVVKTLPIYYFKLLEYMCEVLKLLTIQNPREFSFKKNLTKRLNTEFPIQRENWITFLMAKINISFHYNPLLNMLIINFYKHLRVIY